MTITYQDFQATGTLPPRMSQVLVRMMSGLTSKEIARDLGNSHKTVDHTLETLTKKLGARNRVHLAALAVSEGLVKRVALCFLLACGSTLSAGTDDLVRPVRAKRGRDDFAVELVVGGVA